jgi:hypothetical protein
VVTSSARLAEIAYDHFNKTGQFLTDLKAKQIYINGNFKNK